MKERLDVLLVNRGLAPSREKAKTLIMEGKVFVNHNREDKAGSTFPDDCQIEIHGETLKYVSRGGLKLEKAMNHFTISLEGKVCMDIGASTGGFTDCMLQNGASKVFSVDVGYGQFAWKLRQDPRVVCMEKTNIRYVTPEQIAQGMPGSVKLPAQKNTLNTLNHRTTVTHMASASADRLNQTATVGMTKNRTALVTNSPATAMPSSKTA